MNKQYTIIAIVVLHGRALLDEQLEIVHLVELIVHVSHPFLHFGLTLHSKKQHKELHSLAIHRTKNRALWHRVIE